MGKGIRSRVLGKTNAASIWEQFVRVDENKVVELFEFLMNESMKRSHDKILTAWAVWRVYPKITRVIQ